MFVGRPRVRGLRLKNGAYDAERAVEEVRAGPCGDPLAELLIRRGACFDAPRARRLDDQLLLALRHAPVGPGRLDERHQVEQHERLRVYPSAARSSRIS